MFDELFNMYVRNFQEHGERALLTICNCKVPSDVVISKYKKLPPIETLPEKEQVDMFEYAKEIYPDGDDETRLRFTKIVYTIGTLL